MRRWLKRLLAERSGQSDQAPAPDASERLDAARQRLKETIEPVSEAADEP